MGQTLGGGSHKLPEDWESTTGVVRRKVTRRCVVFSLERERKARSPGSGMKKYKRSLRREEIEVKTGITRKTGEEADSGNMVTALMKKGL